MNNNLIINIISKLERNKINYIKFILHTRFNIKYDKYNINCIYYIIGTHFSFSMCYSYIILSNSFNLCYYFDDFINFINTDSLKSMNNCDLLLKSLNGIIAFFNIDFYKLCKYNYKKYDLIITKINNFFGQKDYHKNILSQYYYNVPNNLLLQSSHKFDYKKYKQWKIQVNKYC